MSKTRIHEPGVEVYHVWKKFRRGEIHDSLRDLIPSIGKRLLGRGPRGDELTHGDFWALQDVSFQVRPGEVLGIIGANGAGKSTMLKVLTRILRPNRGTYVVRGHVGALIEVAAGFHPDLTGRENVFLQGAIMGMKAAEIRARFDEIVEFAGIADAIDTPVKRYSSGMNARLGFSIAAHLDPDVLIIDEVLAVGDFEFQQRAFDRMRSLAKSGLPVVVVSHQLDRVAELCTQAILLERGAVIEQGTAHECIEAYVRGSTDPRRAPPNDSPVHLDTVTVLGAEWVRSGDWFRFRVEGHISQAINEELELVGLRVRALHTGEYVFATSTSRLRVDLPVLGPFAVDVELQLNVPPANYIIETTVWDPRRNRDVATGPTLRLEVVEGASFDGPVQMNPRMQLVPAGDAAEGPAGSCTGRRLARPGRPQESSEHVESELPQLPA